VGVVVRLAIPTIQIKIVFLMRALIT
jgi:hypothetical protein